jgi:hypothetical protein
VKKYLVNEVDDPVKINFQVDLDIRDPFDHYDNIQLPPYLEMDGGGANAGDYEESEALYEGELDDSSIPSQTRGGPRNRNQGTLNDSNLRNDSVVMNQANNNVHKGMFKVNNR